MRPIQRAALSAAAAIAIGGSAVTPAAAAAGPAAPEPAGPAHGPRAAHAAAGTLWAWGDDSWGDLGDGTTTSGILPVTVKVPAGVKVTAVSAGLANSVALTSTGKVLAWGNNFSGELGDGTTQLSHLPVQVKIPPGVTITAVQAGCHDSMALTSTGKVLTWGSNIFGQLGNGTRTNSALPVFVSLPKGTTVTAISAGCFFNLALTSTGTVLGWGRNDTGQLGISDDRRRLVPARVRIPRNVKIAAISAGPEGGAAITAGGQVWVWAGAPLTVAMPPRSQVGTVTAIAVGGSYGIGYDLALTSRGIVLAWGINGDGQLGDGNNISTVYQPVRVRLPSNVRATAIAASFDTAFALMTGGYVLAWGAQDALGDGAGPNTDIPVQTELPPSRTVIAVTTGSASFHAFAILR